MDKPDEYNYFQRKLSAALVVARDSVWSRVGSDVFPNWHDSVWRWRSEKTRHTFTCLLGFQNFAWVRYWMIMTLRILNDKDALFSGVTDDDGCCYYHNCWSAYFCYWYRINFISTPVALLMAATNFFVPISTLLEPLRPLLTLSIAHLAITLALHYGDFRLSWFKLSFTLPLTTIASAVDVRSILIYMVYPLALIAITCYLSCDFFRFFHVDFV